jgi:hypothetical protein
LILCERCGKLGHINQMCQAFLPWECVASVCAFQKPGQGFFYFPDYSSVKQVKERASSLVITILRGNPSFRDIEQEFNMYLGTGWRLIRLFCITILYYNLLLFIDIFHI